MKVKFLRSFGKDLKKINDAKLLQTIKEVVIELENAKDISAIKNLQKLKGFKNAYRIGLGTYRIGLFLEEDTLLLARMVKRGDIYKLFP